MKKLMITLALLSAISFNVFSSESATSAFVEGCKAYSQGEWASAKFMLKKAVSYKQNFNPDTYYMLIAAEINDGDYKTALDDCNTYLKNFANSIYYARISYLKGKVLYSLGEYEKAIITLGDFCHQNAEDELYSFALFYIGESLFASYQYDDAESIYERIVTEFPESAKTPAAQYRIDSILQRAREEKLLYLLKQTGEEYLSAKEEYEKQLRLYNSESINTTRQKLAESQLRNEELEKQVSDLESQIANLQSDIAEAEEKKSEVLYADDLDVPEKEPYDETASQLRLLKIKALEAQRIIENNKVEKE